MMNSILNQVQLLGHLGQAPEVKLIGSDKKLVRFSLATNESYRNATGDLIEKTQWHTISAWGKLAETIERLAFKGSKVAIKGKLHHSQYEKDGEKRYRTEVIANEFLVLSPRQS